ncbi:VOC family protein [Geodermatophilus sp. SYSU D00758]
MRSWCSPALPMTGSGRQTGGGVASFLSTTEITRTHARLRAAGVRFLESPRREPYGTVAVFADPYGNRWNLVGAARDGA